VETNKDFVHEVELAIQWKAGRRARQRSAPSPLLSGVAAFSLMRRDFCFVGEQSEVAGVAVVVDKRAWLAKAKILTSDLGGHVPWPVEVELPQRHPATGRFRVR
jgi:hypothetical protein